MSLPFHAAKEVLVQFRDQFISDMDAAAVVFDLLDKGIISAGDKKDITREPNRADQNKILYETLKQKCTDETLMHTCDIIIAVEGNPRMTGFGEKLKKALQSIAIN